MIIDEPGVFFQARRQFHGKPQADYAVMIRLEDRRFSEGDNEGHCEIYSVSEQR